MNAKNIGCDRQAQHRAAPDAGLQDDQKFRMEFFLVTLKRLTRDITDISEQLGGQLLPRPKRNSPDNDRNPPVGG